MRRSKLITVAGLFLAAVSTPLWADTPARPGTLNYVEGQAAMGGQSLDAKSVGKEMAQGQSITTLNGKAEILLTPGVFLRLGPNSSATMVANGLADTQVELNQGHAMIEADQLFAENHISMIFGGFNIALQKHGLYDFDATEHQVRVFDGEAVATNGAHRVELKGGHMLNVASLGDLKTHGFDKKAYEGDLYNWSSLRASYLAEANITTARTYVSGPGFWGAGWYWNPWYSAYTFIPGDGFFFDPFGWGFYSPLFVYRAPFFGYYGGYRSFGHYAPPAAFVAAYHGGAAVGYRAGTTVGSYHASAAPAFRGGFSGGGGSRGGRR
jgi:uncharacterized membrane protein YgcG